ncbi:hypothetical protein OSB04_012381 [Centaurea solstitialis]|uniref:RRM domain-containing protein n=1 Tax=Centaurea solstitialis TaxID=347529 RepID=A0AA38WDX2_9ASTR|nr:hypothetical protein OSB04_012381 [Centaurea solstitialis]
MHLYYWINPNKNKLEYSSKLNDNKIEFIRCLGQPEFRRRNKSVHDQTRAVNTTFYVSNLPEGTDKRSLWIEMEKVGAVVDAYIANKKGKHGNTFGFVRFIKVQNAKDMEKKLEEVIIKGNRLVANVARYERKNQRSNIIPPNHVPSAQRHPDVIVPPKKVGERRSYAEVVSNKRNLDTVLFKDTITIHLPLKAEAPSFRNSSEVLMGETKNLQILENMMDFLKAEGIDDCSVQFTGGLTFIITFGSTMSADNFLFNHKSTWSHWFSWVRKYHKIPRSKKKAVWVNLMGLPPHFWMEENIHRILCRFGRVLILATCKRDTLDLSSYKACLLVDLQKRIDEKVQISWKGNVYTLWINEIFEPWSPEFTFEYEMEDDFSETPTQGAATNTGEAEKTSDNSVIGETELEEGEFINSEVPNELNADGGNTVNPKEVFPPQDPVHVAGKENLGQENILDSECNSRPTVNLLPPRPTPSPIFITPTFDLNIPLIPSNHVAEGQSSLNNRARQRPNHRQSLKSSVFGNSSRHVERGRLERNKTLINRRSLSGTSSRVLQEPLGCEEDSGMVQSVEIRVEEEIHDTINLGNQIGFQMNGYEAEVRGQIDDNSENAVGLP